ncbi:ThiF family adenylyltransferase [Leptolyngbya sp. AN03gr2]|uniref:ThiF family adenylyltransferase n=1 Tax=unclassified Leptolyngbya TaxID=2650499 RepID=UPI003D310314
MTIFRHETSYRSPALMQKLQSYRILVCGAGALGANIAENLARQGFRSIAVIDRDRVEDQNRSTQPYGKSDVGLQKVKALYSRLYREVGIQIDTVAKEVTQQNAKNLLQGYQLIVDTFDNTESRQAVKDTCLSLGIPCLHVGMASDYSEIIWNEAYKVPSQTHDDLCDYPLARNLIVVTTGIASEVMIQSIAFGIKAQKAYSVTLKDLQISSWVIDEVADFSTF